MKILLTGAKVYIGRRLLPVLLEQGHTVVAAVRDRQRLDAARNFVRMIDQTEAKQIIYLGGISNADKLSKHLASRRDVEDVLSRAKAGLLI